MLTCVLKRMQLITKTEDLSDYCKFCETFDYITIDTEFLRERTYFAQLCLVQIAAPGDGLDGVGIIDTLSPEIDLTPLYDLLKAPSVTKVFHAARQDLEIFYVQGGVVPKPFFDTQVAAMVCGFGEQVGYETLVRKVAKTSLDKSSRFTDWSRRPLSQNQLNYAIGDVTHLRTIYEDLSATLDETGRRAWVEEELETLTDPGGYVVDPDEAWKRIKTRTNSSAFLAIVRELAKFREEVARARNIPRNRVMKDDALLEIASVKPKTHEDLKHSRLLLRDARRGDLADGILAAVQTGLACDPKNRPKVPKRPSKSQGTESLSDLLRVLLKSKAEASGVATKLIATADDLERIASGETEGIAALSGWRSQIFGDDAMRLVRGEIALSAVENTIRIVSIDPAGITER
jgi:ribonuclease D